MRIKKQIKDIIEGDILLLDYYHMDERPHKVIEVNRHLGLFGEDCIDFYVDVWGKTFTTFSMNPEQFIDVEVTQYE